MSQMIKQGYITIVIKKIHMKISTCSIPQKRYIHDNCNLVNLLYAESIPPWIEEKQIDA